MIEFFSALPQHSFLIMALLAAVLSAIPCGVVGSYVVAKRVTYVAGGIAHCILGGIGIAHYLYHVHNCTWAQPMVGALIAALLAALIIGLVTVRQSEREDTIIGALWASGMAIGLLFMSMTPGYSTSLVSYLFGNILLVTTTDIYFIIALDVVICGLVLLFYRHLLAVSFDQEYASLRGLSVQRFTFILLFMVALTVVLLVNVVGIVLVIALLTLPPAIASRFSKNLWQMMGLSTLICLFCSVGGLALSYEPNLPVGATIIVLAGSLYLLTVIILGIKKKLRKIKQK